MNIIQALKRLKPGRNRDILTRVQESLDNLRTLRDNLKEKKTYYASLPLWDQNVKLPFRQWVYFLDGLVGVYFLGNPVYNQEAFSHAKLRTSKEVELPSNKDEDREITIVIERGYCINRSTGEKRFTGSSFHFERGELMSISICGEFKIVWVPALPTTLV